MIRLFQSALDVLKKFVIKDDFVCINYVYRQMISSNYRTLLSSNTDEFLYEF